MDRSWDYNSLTQNYTDNNRTEEKQSLWILCLRNKIQCCQGMRLGTPELCALALDNRIASNPPGNAHLTRHTPFLQGNRNKKHPPHINSL